MYKLKSELHITVDIRQSMLAHPYFKAQKFCPFIWQIFHRELLLSGVRELYVPRREAICVLATDVGMYSRPIITLLRLKCLWNKQHKSIMGFSISWITVLGFRTNTVCAGVIDGITRARAAKTEELHPWLYPYHTRAPLPLRTLRSGVRVASGML